jgi:phosphohistidine phosphatase
MTRELMLLRHAKSDWTTAVDDIDRPITDPGKRGIQRLGVWLAQQSSQPDFVLSSPAERAWTTTKKTIKAMGRGIDDVETDERIYNGEVATLLAVLADVPATAERALLVGHNPGMEDLIGHLDHPGTLERVPPGTLTRLTLPDDWSSLGPAPPRSSRWCVRRNCPRDFRFPVRTAPNVARDRRTTTPSRRSSRTASTATSSR